MNTATFSRYTRPEPDALGAALAYEHHLAAHAVYVTPSLLELRRVP